MSFENEYRVRAYFEAALRHRLLFPADSVAMVELIDLIRQYGQPLVDRLVKEALAHEQRTGEPVKSLSWVALRAGALVDRWPESPS